MNIYENFVLSLHYNYGNLSLVSDAPQSPYPPVHSSIMSEYIPSLYDVEILFDHNSHNSFDLGYAII